MPLVLLDLDRTLLTRDYQICVPDIADWFARAHSRGLTVGLNSDTPIPSLVRWAQQIGIDGPLIGENGSVLSWPARRLHEVLFDLPIDALRRRYVSNAMERFPTAFVAVGDVTTLVRTNPSVFLEHDVAILLNGLREASVSLYAKAVDGYGRLGDAEAILIEATTLLTQLTAEHELKVQSDPDYGFASAHHPEASKANGVRALRASLGDAPVYMVGDSVSDIIRLDDVIHCAVGNASEGFKQAADFIARGPYGCGVVEALEWIAERETRLR